MQSLHAHVESYATDCDGPISRTYDMVMSDIERNSEFGDIDFHNRVLAHVVNTYSMRHTGTLRVERLGGPDDEVRLEWSEVTDEGSVSLTATICGCPDGNSEPTYRDHRAESMGY